MASDDKSVASASQDARDGKDRVAAFSDGAKDDVSELTAALNRATVDEKSYPQPVEDFASWIENGEVNKILVVTGAGISVSAGIPDFRSPGTGLYDNLQKYDLPFPEAVFDLDFFAENPQPFVTLAKELWPTGITFKPTITHCFLTLLAQKKLLLRVYSQNIDGLEHLAELPNDKLVECHGHFRTASCIKCGRAASDMDDVKNTVLVKAQVPVCTTCRTGYVKPDIVFFGEGLPNRFHSLLPRDLRETDCCLVLGTSLQVAPVSMIPEKVGRDCKRVLLNRELVGSFDHESGWHHKLKGKSHKNDIHLLGDCDASIRTLAERLGWLEELEEMHSKVTSA